jgi:hypothetical protein
MLIRQARAGSKSLMAMPADFFWKMNHERKQDY